MVGKFVQVINNNNNNNSSGGSGNTGIGIRNPIDISLINYELKPRPDDLENDPRGRVVVCNTSGDVTIKVFSEENAEYNLLVCNGTLTLDVQGSPFVGKTSNYPMAGDMFFSIQILVFNRVIYIFPKKIDMTSSFKPIP